MTNFEAGTRVRVTPQYAESVHNKDGSMTTMVGKEGVVTTDYRGPIDLYVESTMPDSEFTWLFLPEELEAV